MFLKPYKLKSNVPVKGSDVKKLRQRLEQAFPNVNSERFVPAKANVSLLKLTTHANNQKLVYCIDKLPMFFEIENGVLVPTVYMLWQVDDLLCYFTTHPDVLPRISNGADLMLPGVVPQGTGMNMYGHYKKGQLMAINLTTNSKAIAVGQLTRSSDDLYMSGGRGIAVEILHSFGDKLWSHEPSLVQQVPATTTNTIGGINDFPPLDAKNHSKFRIEIKEETVDTTITETGYLANSQESLNDLTNLVINDEKIAEETHNELTMESILKRAFLAALKNHGKSLQLPLLTSNFYRLYMVPEAEQTLDLKKTKYKKLSNFLNEMIDEGFIVVREEAKGIDKITSIDLEHPVLVNFITDVKTTATGASTSGPNQNPLFKTELTELYTVTDTTAPLFTKMNYKRGEGVPAAQIKKILREYINKEKLLVTKEASTDKSYILDETLQSVCKFPTGTLNKIVSGVIAEMEHTYQMCTAKDISNKKPIIQMSIATRSGNKKVTLVSNIECYGIIMTEFIKLCKQGAAASTTIITLPNQKQEMLQIQGNQIRFIYKLLTETYKISPKCITGMEFAKSEKKHKKK